MADDETLAAVLRRLRGGKEGEDESSGKGKDARKDKAKGDKAAVDDRGAAQVLRLADFEFAQGGHLMANKSCELPEGSKRKTHKGCVQTS